MTCEMGQLRRRYLSASAGEDLGRNLRRCSIATLLCHASALSPNADTLAKHREGPFHGPLPVCRNDALNADNLTVGNASHPPMFFGCLSHSKMMCKNDKSSWAALIEEGSELCWDQDAQRHKPPKQNIRRFFI